jgi:hypothetical protein
MPLAHLRKELKSSKELLKEERINKLRKLKGEPPIDFGPPYREYDSSKYIWE